MPLHTCTCSFAKQMREDVQKKINAGLTLNQILDSLKTQYGPTVLSTPPWKGFFISAWVFPFIGLVIGGGFIVVYLRYSKKKILPASQKPSVGPSDSQTDRPPDENNLQEIFRKYDR